MEIELERSSLAKTRKVPELSLGSFTEGSQNDQLRFIDQLYTGIKDYGFIVLKDHGISPELLQSAYATSEKFFRLSTQAKIIASNAHTSHREAVTAAIPKRPNQ